jgi:uncharacterized protein YceK
MIKLLSIIIVFLALQGCASAISKGLGPDTNQFGHPYSGIIVWSELTCDSKEAEEKAESGTDDGNPDATMTDIFFFTVIGVPALVLWVIDLPLTFVADTVLAPIDLLLEPTEPKVKRCG